MCGDKELLPTAVTPQHYDLHLSPDLEAFTYTGEMTVQLLVHGGGLYKSVNPVDP
jgi:hypothetical protein